ncbi:MAG: hypothetical protein ACRD4R_13030 [Candidatus Acidiferrales bacterium]
MSSLLPNIPLGYMLPSQKYALINWLVSLGLPARIMREVLEQWGAALGVEISSGDYDLLNNHLRTTPFNPSPAGS